MAEALSDAEFADRMAALGPFEAAPEIAAGVSGGADSMALVLLLHRWAVARGGRVLALTVDHGLRPDSRAEAADVGRRLAARGIQHRTLPWTGPPWTGPRLASAAAARAARYALLGAACRTAGVLHLAVGHHQGDQAETVLLRGARGSGPLGLAGMAAARDGWPRLLRPLLRLPRARLAATAAAAGATVVDDPSNRDPRFARARLRAELAADEAADGQRQHLALALAERAAGVRAEAERGLASLAAACLSPAAGGHAWLTLAPLAAAPGGARRALLARVLQAVGGGAYPPRGERLDRLADAVAAGALGAGQTLGGCRLVPHGQRLLICREWQRTAPPVPVAADGSAVWDRRFRIQVAGDPPRGLSVAALGAAGWRDLGGVRRADLQAPPHPARLSLPALRAGATLVAVPHLGVRPDCGAWSAMAWFRPAQPVTGAWAALVSASTTPIYGV